MAAADAPRPPRVAWQHRGHLSCRAAHLHELLSALQLFALVKVRSAGCWICGTACLDHGKAICRDWATACFFPLLSFFFWFVPRRARSDSSALPRQKPWRVTRQAAFCGAGKSCSSSLASSSWLESLWSWSLCSHSADLLLQILGILGFVGIAIGQ